MHNRKETENNNQSNMLAKDIVDDTQPLDNDTKIPQNSTKETLLTSHDLVTQAITLITTKLEDIQNNLDNLGQAFQNKLKYDEHKEKVIDRLHNELQEYKNY
ncbi:MAG TPA: hypothetical protein VJL89_09095, partial [Thermodesulfovibrionia bacterium]|nr:hypothetical protein [Thermodesulfovibrionia bacterium]